LYFVTKKVVLVNTLCVFRVRRFNYMNDIYFLDAVLG
jgi:hypothetical protein